MAKRMTQEEFIQKALIVHGGRYDYSKVKYEGNKVKVCIICPLHGEFWHTPHDHLSGQKCPKCRYSRGYKSNFEKIDGEVWKPVKNFELFYKISNKGRLMSSFSGEWQLLSNRNSKGGYFSVILRNGKIHRSIRIHRLVYETFVGEIPKGMIIHHTNGNKQDNSVENLVLLTKKQHAQEHKMPRQENESNGIRKHKRKYEGIYNNNINAMIYYNKYVKTKKLLQYDLCGNYIATYSNCKEASVATGVCQRNILQVANKEPFNKKGNIRKQAGGYIWKFKE